MSALGSRMSALGSYRAHTGSGISGHYPPHIGNTGHEWQSSDSYLHPEAERTYRGKDRGPLFHNKFNMELERVVMTCMEGELKRRNKLEFVDNCFV